VTRAAPQPLSQALQVFEEVNRAVPLSDLNWFFDHCETISDRNIERIKALGGGIAIQHRMAYQGEYFVERYGTQQAQRTPPIRRMLEMGVPVEGGDGRHARVQLQPFVASSGSSPATPWAALPVPGTEPPRPPGVCGCIRSAAHGSPVKRAMKGAMVPGQLADLAVLSADYFAIPEEDQAVESVLTIVGGHVVYATDAFATLAPPPLPVSPDWSPVKHYGGYASTRAEHAPGTKVNRRAHAPESLSDHGHRRVMGPSGLWRLGCDCFAI
jgi:hypothetical protein